MIKHPGDGIRAPESRSHVKWGLFEAIDRFKERRLIAQQCDGFACFSVQQSRVNSPRQRIRAWPNASSSSLRRSAARNSSTPN